MCWVKNSLASSFMNQHTHIHTHTRCICIYTCRYDCIFVEMDICVYDSWDMHVNNRSIHIKARYTFCAPTIQVYLCCTPKAVRRVSFEQHISSRWALPHNHLSNESNPPYGCSCIRRLTCERTRSTVGKQRYSKNQRILLSQFSNELARSFLLLMGLEYAHAI